MHGVRGFKRYLPQTKSSVLCTILLSSFLLAVPSIAEIHIDSNNRFPFLHTEILCFGNVSFTDFPIISLEASEKRQVDLEFSALFQSKGSADAIFFNVFINSLEKYGSYNFEKSTITVKGLVTCSTYIYTDPYLYVELSPTVYPISSKNNSHYITCNYDMDISELTRTSKKKLVARHESMVNCGDLQKIHVFGSLVVRIGVAGCIHQEGDVGSLTALVGISSSSSCLDFEFYLPEDQVLQRIETSRAEVLQSLPNYVKCQINAVPHVFHLESLYFQWHVSVPRPLWPPEPPLSWILTALTGIVMSVVLQQLYKKLHKRKILPRFTI